MNNKPSIYQMGRVHEDSGTVTVTGWGLGLCVPACHCHAHPRTGQLSIDQNGDVGTLGLVCHREGGCDCCEPWTSDELAGMRHDFDEIAAIEEIEVAEVVEVIKAVKAVEVIEVIEDIEATEDIEGNEGVGS